MEFRPGTFFKTTDKTVKENHRMPALNKAGIRRWYSVASMSVTRSGCENACPSRKAGFTGSATRKPLDGCYGQLKRHGKRIASLARFGPVSMRRCTVFLSARAGVPPAAYRLYSTRSSGPYGTPNTQKKQRFLASGAA